MQKLGILAVPFLMLGTTIAAELSWRQDYADAYQEAQEANRLLIVSFHASGELYQPDEAATALLKSHVPAAIPLDATITQNGQPVPVIASGAFRKLKEQPGLAIINLKYPGSRMGHVVATLPLEKAKAPGELAQALEDIAVKFGEKVVTDAFGLQWYTEYATAFHQAKSAKKLLFIAIDGSSERFVPDLELADALRELVLLRLQLNESSSLLSQVGMRKFHFAAGVGVVNLKHDGADYGRLTHVIPARLLTKAGTHAMLALADGRREDVPAVHWHDDYLEARRIAEQERKMLLIAIDSDNERFQPRDQSLPLLHGYVCLRQTPDARYSCRRGIVRRLFDFRDFRQLREKPGLAVYDFSDETKPYHGQVVTAMPYKYLGPNPGNRVFSEAERENELLLLEPETLTRRTLTWAIRVSKGHGENTRLRSADGAPCETRMAGAQRNSVLMTSYGVGHHAGGLMGGEIASPGPGQDIVDGALNMVRIWRGSPPHYGMMVRFHRRFGYDMHPSSNNHWYGTGRF
ncbi:MAG: hypothetical protein RBS80_24070 [Thermoguttaceae bacterium]|jgi:hypothetical protein|nr:hypothetical protein [Thermoguttaceae bacterium]